MKTFLQKLTLVYLVLITVACVTFCTLFCINLPKGKDPDGSEQPKTLTVAEATQMINDACDQFNIEVKTAGSSVSSNSIDYTDYLPEAKINLADPAIQILTPYYIATLQMGKYFVDHNIEQNVWLEDKTSYQETGASYYYRWYIEENQTFIESTSSAKGTLDDAENWPEFPHWQLVVLTKVSKTEWKGEMYYSVVTTSAQDDEGNPVSGVNFGYGLFETKEDNLWHIYFEGGAARKTGSKYFQGFETADEVTCGIYEVNLQTNKIHDSFSTAENQAKLTGEEKLTVARRCLNYRNAQNIFYTSEDFTNATKSDNLATNIFDYFKSAYGE